MSRILLAGVSAYGFFVSSKASRNIQEVRKNALAGDRAAQMHFTQSRYAHVFGPRNSDLGMVFYGMVHVAASSGLVRMRSVSGTLLVCSVFSLATSLYLLWALIARLRVWCPICMRGHAVNVAIYVLLLRMWRSRAETVTAHA